MENLTPSKEHYIKTIFFLSTNNKGVHITEIAEKLEVNKASVCTAMNNLQKDKFVYRGKKRMVYLTEKGTQYALVLKKKYETIKCFLINTLKLDSEIAIRDACAMEHFVSEETLQAMRKAVLK